MAQEIKISKRLEIIASFISDNVTFADIGSDHAYLPCYICKLNSTINAIAGEVAIGPYESAKKTVASFGMSDNVEVVFGDGLDIIDSTVTEVVIAGMGGLLIKSIIENGEHKLKNIKRMIIQPNNGEENVRNVLLKYDYTITDELIMEENNHIYEIIVAERDQVADPYSPIIEFKKQQIFGPILMHNKSTIFSKKWLKEKDNLVRIIQTMEKAKQRDDDKIRFFTQKVEWIEEVLGSERNES